MTKQMNRFCVLDGTSGKRISRTKEEQRTPISYRRRSKQTSRTAIGRFLFLGRRIISGIILCLRMY